MTKSELVREYWRLMGEVSDAYARCGIAGDLTDNRKKAYQIRQILTLMYGVTL